MKKRKFVQVLTCLRTAKFKVLPRPLTRNGLMENADQMRANLWSMFDVKYSPVQLARFHESGKFPFGSNCADYAWSESVKEGFYTHPLHARLVRQIKKMKGMTWGLWALNVEPSDVTDEEAVKLSKTKRRKK